MPRHQVLRPEAVGYRDRIEHRAVVEPAVSRLSASMAPSPMAGERARQAGVGSDEALNQQSKDSNRIDGLYRKISTDIATQRLTGGLRSTRQDATELCLYKQKADSR